MRERNPTPAAYRLGDRVGLRDYDSVHLATAGATSLLLMPVRLTFVYFDDRLNDAAKALGMVDVSTNQD